MFRKKKKCPKCGEEKSINRFFRDKSKKDGRESICEVCRKKYRQAYAQTEKGKQAKKRYSQSVKGKQSYIRYNKSPKGTTRSRKGGIIYRTRKTKAGGSYTSAEWYALCEYYEFYCLMCGHQFPFDQLTVDHIKPVSKGGSSDISNTQPLCKPCNSSKGSEEIDYRKAIWQQDTLF